MNRSPTLPPIRPRDALGFDARGASNELLDSGITLVDDVSEGLVDVCEEELMDELGHAADELDVRRTRVATGWGPVFVFRDRDRVSLSEARKLVAAHRPRPVDR